MQDKRILGLFFQHIENCNPQSYSELHAYAKLLCADYRSVRNATVEVLTAPKDMSEAIKAIENLRNYTELEKLAHSVYLGARAAEIENVAQQGEKEHGIAHVIAAGSMMYEMVVPAIVYSSSEIQVNRNDSSSQATIARQASAKTKELVSDVFDKIATRKAQIERYKTPLFMPKPDTVIRVLQEEIGYISDNVQRSFKTALLSPKLG
ncbi:MAG: hypothetical protein ABTQ34_01400 [Bdellovibrionales bacterium]